MARITRKKVIEKTTPVFLTDRNAAGAAPDNPRTPPIVTGHGKGTSNTAGASKDNRSRPVASETLDENVGSVPTSVGPEKVDSADRSSDQQEKITEDDSSRQMTSLLTPLDGVEQLRLSPIQ